ncbi:MAG: VOC family protein [Ilumatobacter sp.]|uniref:VOC family protein n=1 Tax=Ilumatobacter sp. TaxID=1967498 RepID=UPI0026126821|nr:VOC family protein [Ilumatobacter sp.]MDJ0768291.1 VOC family protein [Ilumatobacter sp.]
MTTPRFRVAGTVLATRDAQALAAFYERLLGWPRRASEPGWVVLRPDGRSHGLSFHEDAAYVPPVWPSRVGEQQIMIHLDIATDDLDAAIGEAVAAGATVAEHQPQPGVWVMLDPDGHPFCLFESDLD